MGGVATLDTQERIMIENSIEKRIGYIPDQ